MRVKIHKPVPVRRHTRPVPLPSGRIPIRAVLRKQLRDSSPGIEKPERTVWPETFYPITQERRNTVPKVKKAGPRKQHRARFFEVKTKKKVQGNPWRSRPDRRKVEVYFSAKEYRRLRLITQEFMISLSALIRLMVRRFMTRGIVLSGMEVDLADYAYGSRASGTLRKMLEETIFVPNNARGDNPDHLLYRKNHKRMQQIGRLQAYRLLRKTHPPELWAKYGCDTWRAFMARYCSIPDAPGALERRIDPHLARRYPEDEAQIQQDRAAWAEDERARQQQAQQDAEPPDLSPNRLVSFAGEKRRRLITRRPA